MINDQETHRHVVTSYTGAPTRTITAGGVSFAYRELGPDTGVPVIFLTHLAAVLDNWDPRVVDGIAARHRVITFDNRGVGASTGSTPDTIAAMAKDAVTFIRALGLDEVDLLGFSMGGMIAQVIAQDRTTTRPQADPRGHRARRRRGHQERDQDLPSATPSGHCSPSRTPNSSCSSPGHPTDARPARNSWPA